MTFADAGFSRRDGFGDWVGSRIGVFAHNYNRYGLLRTKGAQILNVAQLEDLGEAVIYRGHPATVPLATSAVFWLTGSNQPWAHRVLPFLASLVSLVLLGLIARASGLSAAWTLIALVSVPLFGWHGGTPSYEPFCLAAMLAIVAAYQRGWRIGLAPLVFVGCLIDFPCLYVVPALAAAEWIARRAIPWRYALLWSAMGVLAVAFHFAHIALLDGGLTGQWGQSIQGKIWDALSKSSLQPTALEFAEAHWSYAQLAFGLPLMGVALAGCFLAWRRIGLVGWSFLLAGVLHVLIFRWHAVRHDFWMYYFIPFVAVAASLALQRLPLWVAMLAGSGLVASGLWQGAAIWQERASVPVTEVARDVKSQIARLGVVHQARGPEACSIDLLVDGLVLNLPDLMTQAVQAHSFRDYVDGIALFGGIGQRQIAYLYGPGMKPADLRVMEQFFPGSQLPAIEAAAGKYYLYDITPFMREPAKSQTLRQMLGEGECLLHREWIRVQSVLDRFAPGERVWWVTERLQLAERQVRRRSVRIGNGIEVPKDRTSWTLVAWPEGRRTELLGRLAPSLQASVMEVAPFGQNVRLRVVPASGAVPR
ncbi:MAG: hypothetical protein H6832_09295 [Planctomycetes bacterium]|nr:hypothetical protein [Planctomycetota bacterium]